jgi:hypothetical protein
VLDAPVTPACVDSDGDRYQVSIGGATCAQPVDCDDADDRAHPGQEEAFSTPRTGGGFDFDCSGVETLGDDRQGRACQWDLFVCRGTGWLGQIPSCGEFQNWHRCRGEGLTCREVTIGNIPMPCF